MFPVINTRGRGEVLRQIFEFEMQNPFFGF